jgi:hypothetical protein
MPFTKSGKHYSLHAKRLCKNCGVLTDQQAISCKYSATPKPKVPPAYLKTTEWLYERCDHNEAEVKEVLEVTDKAMIMNRLMRILEDYDVLGYSITSEADGITFKIRLPDHDMGEIRAIKAKARETGFITVDELIRVQKAGFDRPIEVPPKPKPKDRHVLRERARERIFQEEPRPV